MTRFLLLLHGCLLSCVGFTQTIFFTETFESPANWTASDNLNPNFWHISSCAGNGPSLPGTSAAYITHASAIDMCGQIPGNTLSGGGTNMATFSTAMDASCYRNLSATFDYLFAADASESATMVYSVDGGSNWTVLGSNLSASAGWTTYTIALPAALNESSFLFGFRFTYDNVNASGTGFEIDNIVLIGDDETTPPTIICPGSISSCNPLVNYSDPTFSDNCTVSIFQSDLSGLSSGMSFPVGITMLEYTATDAAGNTSTCSFNVEILDYPAPASIAEDTLHLCNQNSLVLSADPIASGSGLWTVATGQGSFNNEFANQTGVNNLGSGTNVFIWTVSSASCGTLSDTLVVVNAQLDLPASTQDTLISCSQENILLLANAPLYGVGTWTTNAGAQIDDLHSANTAGHLSASGWQYFVWTIANGACPSTHDTLFVLGNLTPEILTSDTAICLDQLPLQLSGIPAALGITTTWSVLSGPGELATPESSETYIDGIALGLNRIIYSSASAGCPTVADTLHLIGELCVGVDPIFPTVITPNYDGSNDLFVINHLEKLYPSCHVTIFNRWGSVVFESTGYEHPWDGTNKGEALPMGTYFYKIELNDGDGTVYRGDISIIH